MSRRNCRLFFCLLSSIAVDLSGQPTISPRTPLPNIERFDRDEIVLRRGSQLWRVDLTRLIENQDCAWPYVQEERICRGRPTAPCPECNRRSAVIGWDSHYRRLYFGVSTGTSRNNPWTVFSYSLITRRVQRFTNTWAATIENGVVSQSGRYLAFLSLGHSGMCANYSHVEIVDLWDRKSARPPLETADNDQITDIKRLTWVSPTVLGYDAVSYSYTGCQAGEQTERASSGRIDVASLGFD